MSAVALVVLAAGAATAIALMHRPARHTPAAHGQSTAPARHTPSARGQSTAPARNHQPNTGSEPWTSATVTITPRSLGAVTIGMTIAQASAAAGQQLQYVGDNFSYPNGSTSAGLYIGGLAKVQCLGASQAGYSPTVVTQRGFPLGGTLTQLKATYGTSLAFVPAPAGGGYSPTPGYVVAFPDGNLAFIVSKGIVTQIEAGPGVQPSSCTG